MEGGENMLFYILSGSGAAGGALDTLGTAVTFLLTQFTNMASTLLSTPLFLIGVGVFVIGASIGLVKRIVS